MPAAGLPVLAALYRLCQRVESVYRRGPIGSAELQAELQPIIMLAIGEGCLRAERRGITIGVPGVPMVPSGAVL